MREIFPKPYNFLPIPIILLIVPIYLRTLLYFYVEISLTSSQKFIKECVVTSKLDHPNVLSLIGVSMNPEDGTIHMVMSFMHHGDVRSFLKSKRGNVIELDHFPKVIHIRNSLCMYLEGYVTHKSIYVHISTLMLLF